MRRAHVGSSDAVVGEPIAEVGQVGEHGSDSRFSWSSVHRPRGRSDGVDVLEDDVSGTKRAKGGGNGEPDLAVLSVDARSLPGEAVVGAGESGGDEVDTGYHAPVCLEEVSMIGYVGPVLGEDLGRGLVLLAVPDPLDVEGEGEAEVEAAAPRAEGAGRQGCVSHVGHGIAPGG